MTKFFKFALLSAALVMATLPSELIAGEPVMIYQRVHSLVASHDNRVTLRVWPDNRMELRFPPYSPRAGRYEQLLDDEQFREFSRIFDGLPKVTQRELAERLESRRDGERFYVADADIVRFEDRRDRGDVIVLAAPAPDVWRSLGHHRAELDAIAETEQALLRWIDAHLGGMRRSQ